MNEKAKKVLSYVACAIGGACLGIALLGGLSYCSTSSAREKTDTINTIDRVRRNANPNGRFTLSGLNYTDSQWENLAVGSAFTITYSVDSRNGNWQKDNTYQTTGINNFADWKSYVDAQYESARSPYEDDLLFMQCLAKPTYGDTPYYFQYFSFVLPTARTPSVDTTPRILVNRGQGQVQGRLDRDAVVGLNNDSYIIATGQSQYFLYSYNGYYPVNNAIFEGVDTYYYDQGHSAGYNEGYDAGETAGNSAGYSSGYSEGHTAGYAEGYDDAYAEKDTGIAFTSCGVYPNAQVTLATDETIGNFKYMYLCHYITKPGYDEHTIYIMWTTNANTGQYLGEVIDRNDTNSYDPAVTLGSFTQQATSSVTITATEDMEFGLWVGYITTFHNRGEITNSILWFQGGTSESDLQIYQNGYNEGYQNGNQQGQETGYDNGYTEGKQAGDAEGYERGYNDGFEQTNTQNVFSLFTSAFGAVSSFFDLKIFGFLPLYWFFLAPLFIALISLLMRMVRH